MTEVRYKCKCMKEERVLKVPPRFVGQDIVQWVERDMGFSIYLDHRTVAPSCREEKMEYAKILMPNDPSAPLGSETYKQ